MELTERLSNSNFSDATLVRVGIATGQVIVGDIIGEGASQESAATGETPNLAARLQSVAEPGSLVIDAVTHSIAASAFNTVAHTAVLKGFTAKVPYWVVVAERRTETRFEARGALLGTFVGRNNELGLLLERWETTIAGDGQVALVSGEPGIGKSRLSEELHRRIGQGSLHQRLRYQCSPFHTLSPFYPIVQHLNRAANVLASDTVQERLDKIEHILLSGDDETLALIAELLSVPHESRYPRLQLTAAVQKQRTVHALVAQLLQIARDKPVRFVLEDAHWVDPSTHDLIRETISAAAHVPVMIVITHRPGWDSGIPEQPHVVTLPLSRLVTRQAVDLVSSVAARSIPNDTIVEIVERAEGIPLFIEELEQLDDGTDTRSLRSQANTLIGEAMMEGRGFASGEVRQALETALALAREARDLEAEFEALRALGPHLLSTTGGAGALSGASRMLEISELLGDEKGRATALDAAGTAHFLLGEQENAEHALESARRLLEGVDYNQFPTKGGADIRIPLYGYLGYVLSLRSKVDRAAVLITKGLSIAREQSHPLTLAWALAVAGRLAVIQGEYGDAERMLDEAIALCGSHGLLQRKGHALALRGRMFVKSGRPKKALPDIEEGLELWRQGGTLFHTTEYLADGAGAHLALGNNKSALEWLNEALEVERSVGEMFNSAERQRLLAQYQLRNGERNLALETLENAIALAHQQGATLLELRAYRDLLSEHELALHGASMRERATSCLVACAEGGITPEVVETRTLIG